MIEVKRFDESNMGEKGHLRNINEITTVKTGPTTAQPLRNLAVNKPGSVDSVDQVGTKGWIACELADIARGAVDEDGESVRDYPGVPGKTCWESWKGAQIREVVRNKRQNNLGCTKSIPKKRREDGWMWGNNESRGERNGVIYWTSTLLQHTLREREGGPRAAPWTAAYGGAHTDSGSREQNEPIGGRDGAWISCPEGMGMAQREGVGAEAEAKAEGASAREANWEVSNFTKRLGRIHPPWETIHIRVSAQSVIHG
ncbi:hypothetical protein DFH09DRAFT_1083929 [Mycena vulgaris]|nr:hypothetical protein DFH09DRAFT_1083929 [Mycena vulgaris]